MFLTRAQFVFGLFPRIDIENHASEEKRVSGRIALNAATRAQPADLTIGSYDAVIDIVCVAAFDRMVFSFLLGANVLVEKVFAWPGIGSYAVEALIASDYAPVQGFVLAMAILYVALNLMRYA